MPLKVIHQGNETVIADDTRAMIGSDSSANVRIARPGISRRHAIVSYDGTGWKLEDAGSRNGTFRDGEQVHVVAIDGPTTLYLGHPAEGEEVALVPVGAAPASAENISKTVEAPPVSAPAAPAPVAAAAKAAPPAAERTRVQPAASAADVELAQLTSAIRDQISAVKGLTWSVWGMIGVTAVLIVLTLFVGILSN